MQSFLVVLSFLQIALSVPDGSNVQIATCYGGASQGWNFPPNSQRLITLKSSGQCADIANYGTSDGSNVQVWDCHTDDTTPAHQNQEWSYNTNTQQVISTLSGKCLDVNGASKDDGANVQIWTCANPPARNQQWVYNSTDSTLRSVDSGKCLDVASNAGSFLSNVLGDHMVLQRAPESAVVWGFATSGVVVSTTFNSQTYSSTADATGVWRQKLPPTNAGGPYTIDFKSSDGQTASLNDILFGDVYLATGQSNMQFTISLALNASNEIATADNYPNIRVFTVGDGTASDTELSQLKTILQKWTPASKSSVGGPDWSYQTAIGWLFARGVYDSEKVPIGLINDNWGGTGIKNWSSSEVVSSCNQGSTNGNLWNAMIYPYTVGPMIVKGWVWYQGENDIGADWYACVFPAMITNWRKTFGSPNAWFGFVQLAGYNYGPGPWVADTRQWQLSALQLENVGYSTAMDVGNYSNIHPQDKQTVTKRLVNSALNMVYGHKDVQYLFPRWASQAFVTDGTTVTATIKLTTDGLGTGLTTNVPPEVHNAQGDICPGSTDTCGWPQIILNDGTTINATATLTSDKQGLVFTGTAPRTGMTGTHTSIGRNAWPVSKFYNSYGLPVIPWSNY